MMIRTKRRTHGTQLAVAAMLIVAAASVGAQEATFTVIPSKILSSVSTMGRGITADGSVAVGVSDGVVWRWSADSGLEYLSAQDWYQTFVSNISADGSTIISTVDDGTGVFSAALYTDASGWTNLGGLPGMTGDDLSTGYSVNGDGTVAVGLAWEGFKAEAFVWTEDQGLVGLGRPATSSSRASDVSADGSVIVGWYENETTGCRRPARWVGGGAVDIFLGADICGEAHAVSSDGSVIVGNAVVPGNPEYTAFRYSDDIGWINLGRLGTSETSVAIATGIADNGTIVGLDGSEVYGIWRGFIWTPVGGSRLLSTYLTELGVDYSGYGIREARDISADGTTIVGTVSNTSMGLQGFVATIPAPVFSDGFEFGSTATWSAEIGGGS